MSVSSIIINGEYNDHLSSLDRGVLYGDGVFETIAIKQGQPQYWQKHLQRLRKGCEVLKLSGLDEALLEAEFTEIIKDDAQCIIKIIVTRGIGARGYKITQQPISRIIQKFPWPNYPSSYYESGIDVTLCNFKLAHQPNLAQIKHLNRLEQILARSEWEDEFQEGLVCDVNNYVIEAISSNVFFQMDNELITPDLKYCGVAGIMRDNVMEYCDANELALTVRNFSLEEIDSISGMFACNSIIGIWPVRRFQHLSLPKTAIIEQLMSAFNT